tara:strand:- start:247 stop:501 length:255 start_codon:yes stop_codon:yes gene_type:complete
MSKILRIDLQTDDRSIFKDEEDLRTSLIYLHWNDVEASYGESWGFTEKEKKQNMEAFKKMTLNQLCSEFDWDYETITDEQAEYY